MTAICLCGIWLKDLIQKINCYIVKSNMTMWYIVKRFDFINLNKTKQKRKKKNPLMN